MKTITRFGVVMLMLGVAVLEANAQGFGLLAERGMGANLGLESQDGTTRFGVNAGYVVNPMFEVGLGLSRTEIDGVDLNMTGVGPLVGFYPVHQSAEIPVSIRLGAGYSRLFFGGDAAPTEADSVQLSGSYMQLSGTVYHGIVAKPSLWIVPLAEAGYNRMSQKTEFTNVNAPDDVSASNGNAYFTVGVSAIFLSSPSSRFAITPAITFEDGDQRFAISAMMVLPR